VVKTLRELAEEEARRRFGPYVAEADVLEAESRIRREGEREAYRDEKEGHQPNPAQIHDGDLPADVRDGLPADADLPGLQSVPRQPGGDPDGSSPHGDDAGEMEGQRGRPRLLTPLGRSEAKSLLGAPPYLKLYLRLSDECDRSRWSYIDAAGYVWFRGYCFEHIEPRTFLFELSRFARSLASDSHTIRRALIELQSSGYLESVVFARLVEDPDDYEDAANCETYGRRLLDYLTPIEVDERWALTAVRIVPARKGFMQLPKEAQDLPDNQLVFLVEVYGRARYKPKKSLRIYNNRTYEIGRGELVCSYHEIARALSFHPEQVRRWAGYAKRRGLLLKIPTGQDLRWKVVTRA